MKFPIYTEPEINYGFLKCLPLISVLSLMNQVQTSHPIYWRLILIFFSHLYVGLSSGLFTSSFLTKVLYEFLLFPMHSTWLGPSHPLWPGHITVYEVDKFWNHRNFGCGVDFSRGNFLLIFWCCYYLIIALAKLIKSHTSWQILWQGFWHLFTIPSIWVLRCVDDGRHVISFAQLSRFTFSSPIFILYCGYYPLPLWNSFEDRRTCAGDFMEEICSVLNDISGMLI